MLLETVVENGEGENDIETIKRVYLQMFFMLKRLIIKLRKPIILIVLKLKGVVSQSSEAPVVGRVRLRKKVDIN